MLRPAVAVWAALCGAAAASAAPAPQRSAWAGSGAPTATVDTNAPVLRWATEVESAGTFAYQVDVTSSSNAAVWSSGEVWQGNWPVHSPAFPGLCVYEGPALTPATTYNFKVIEQQAADATGHNASRIWNAGSGSFITAADLPTPQDELIAELASANMTTLWNTSRASIWQRVEPSGFLPTSVSGGYGGITSEWVTVSIITSIKTHLISSPI